MIIGLPLNLVIIMENVYDVIRRNMNKNWPLKLPKHDKVIKMLELIFPTEEEAKIMVTFSAPLIDQKNVKKISEITEIPVDEVSKICENMANKGTIYRFGKSRYAMMPIMPGLFEFYFISGQSENIKETAEVFHEIIDMGLLNEWYNSEYPFFRTLPSSSLKEKVKSDSTKSIDIGEKIDVEHEILIYEDVESYIKKANSITVVKCACRTTSALIGDPCDKPIDVCMALNFASDSLNAYNLGRKVTQEEALEIIKLAEDNGLVHTIINSSGPNSQMLLCNCCPCHCGVLGGLLKFNNPRSFAKSNYRPSIDQSVCKLCEKCVNICPMEALWHHWPHTKDLSDDYIDIKEYRCIGCGLCAQHCPTNAISMVKSYDDEPEPTLIGTLRKIEETRHH